MDPEVVELIMRVKRDSEYFIVESKKKNKRFSLEKPEDQLEPNEREIRWHLGVIQILDLTLTKMLNQQKQIDELKEELKAQKAANSILTNSVTSFNQRLTSQEKNVSEYLQDINDDIIDLQQAQDNLQHLETENSPNRIEKSILEEHRKSVLKIKPPNFSGNKNAKPMQFIRAFHEYVETMEVRENEILPLLRNCLQESAKNWLYLVDDKISNLEDFEKLFKERFWNEPIQSQMQSRFDLGKFDRNKKLTRVLYAQELISYAQQLELNMPEAELIKKIGRHFNEKAIPRTIRMQNMEKFGQLFDLLQEFDNDQEEYKEKMAKKPQYNKNFNKNNEKKSPEKNVSNEETQKPDRPQGKFFQQEKYQKSYHNGEKRQEKNYGGNNDRYNNKKEQQIRLLEITNPAKQKNNLSKNPQSPDIQINQGN